MVILDNIGELGFLKHKNHCNKMKQRINLFEPSYPILQLLLLLWIGLLSTGVMAQQTKKKNPIGELPDIPGYLTLKADFHLHTVFSDGHVWPSFRVREAIRDGLDVISLTEHIDYEGFPGEIVYNRERGYEIALETARNTDLLVIRGVEISPRVQPYHHNAIFLKDVDAFPYEYMKDTHSTFVMKDDIKRSELMAPFLEAQKQGGFVFYNHPSFNWWDQGERILFTDFHQELLDRGILGGVEVINGNRYNLIAHRMATKYNLTMFANSDEHHDTANTYKDTGRPFTLVFATDKSEAAVEDAIINRRTLAYFDNHLVGRQKEAEAFVKSSLELEPQKRQGKFAPRLVVEVTNKTGIAYDLKFKSEYIIGARPLGSMKLEPFQTQTLLLDPVWEYPEILELEVEVENVLVSPEEHLKMKMEVPVN